MGMQSGVGRKVSKGGVMGTKLLKPKVSGHLVTRNLVDSFSGKMLEAIKVGLVVAPAGYGKSILLSQTSDSLVDKGVKCAWFSLDDKDNDPLRFLSHLVAALKPIDSSVCYNDVEHFGTDRKAVIDYVVADIVNNLEMIDSRCALFIDDYHCITNREVHSILERLIYYSPENTVFIIASRSEPELALNRLKMREELYQLSTDDLSFTLDEAEQFLNSIKKLGLNTKLVGALADRTEGWVAGLQLASLALAGRTNYEKFVGEFTGSDRDVTDYLGEVILDQQSDEIKRFLLWTSVLERMNADLINAVVGLDTAQAIIEQMEANNLFIIPLDRTRTWYRYHHLFGDFLKARLAKEYRGVTAKIYRRAYSWCAEHGYNHEAISYALLAKDYSRAAELIARISKKLVQESGEHWTLLHWVQQLPQNCLLKWPEISLAYAWSLIFSRKASKAREQLGKLERYCVESAKLLTPELIERALYEVNLSLCLVEAASDNTERSSELSKQWLYENSAAEPRDLLTMNVLRAHSTLSTFEFDQGEESANNAILIGKQFGMDFFEAWAQVAMGLLKIQRGELYSAVEHLREGLKYNNRCASQYSFMGSINAVVLAEAYYEQNELEKAEELLQNRFEYIDNETIVEVAYAGYTVMAKLQVLKGNLDYALEIIRLGKESAIRTSLPRLSALLTALEVRSLLQFSKLKEAKYVAKEDGFCEQLAPVFLEDSRCVVQEIRGLVQAELSIENNFPKKALTILDAQIVQSEEAGRVRRLMELLLIRGKAYYALKQQDDALCDVLRALAIGAKGGFYRQFLDADKEIHQLMRLIVKGDTNKAEGGVVGFLGKLNEFLQVEFQRKQGEAQEGEPPETLFEPMTKRERQMLDMITTGETNKNIADKLFISEQTVKWHLHQLYQKLGVKNRTSAIAKAKALSLI